MPKLENSPSGLNGGELDGNRLNLDHLYTLQSTAEITAALTGIYSRFGLIRGISYLESEGRADVFLVDFSEEAPAVAAANLTGCNMFGFNTVIVDLRQRRDGALT